MTATKGYYSLIQYCPDLGRLEAANIGVLLFCPERQFLKAKTSRGNRRIIHFFGSAGHDWKRINLFKQGLEDRLTGAGGEIRTLEQLEHFIAQRANLLQITPPRPMKVLDPEKDLAELYREVVGEVHPQSSTRKLREYVGEKLRKAGLDRKVQRGITVDVPVFQEKIEIPFGFKNGRFNLINPVHFEAANIKQNRITACKYAVEGGSLYVNPDPKFGELQLVVVGKFRSSDRESPAIVRRVFEENRVKLYGVNELARLFEEIRETAIDLSDLADPQQTR